MVKYVNTAEMHSNNRLQTSAVPAGKLPPSLLVIKLVIKDIISKFYKFIAVVTYQIRRLLTETVQKYEQVIFNGSYKKFISSELF
jgi:hypothetical protein